MSLEQLVIESLKRVVDPHTGVSVYDMGLISNLKVENDAVSLTFIPTSPVCPMGLQLARDIKNEICKITGIAKCNVEVVGHLQADLINKELMKC
ncbi:MAG: iron-sulfur cluster assembly protein [Thermoplasmata archaeon]|nr:iron-sulfur cluster assembly protein [Thermoplasmata archaeon]